MIGVILLLLLIPHGVDNPSDIKHITLSPSFWPRIISVLFMLMGLAIVIKPSALKPTNATDGLGRRLFCLFIVQATLFSCYYLIDSLGMVIPCMLVIFGLMWFAGERRYPLMSVISLSTPLLLYFFFVHIANIPIPLGLFEPLRG